MCMYCADVDILKICIALIKLYNRALCFYTFSRAPYRTHHTYRHIGTIKTDLELHSLLGSTYILLQITFNLCMSIPIIMF